jgi:ankyrin repeat protein
MHTAGASESGDDYFGPTASDEDDDADDVFPLPPADLSAPVEGIFPIVVSATAAVDSGAEVGGCVIDAAEAQQLLQGPQAAEAAQWYATVRRTAHARYVAAASQAAQAVAMALRSQSMAINNCAPAAPAFGYRVDPAGAIALRAAAAASAPAAAASGVCGKTTSAVETLRRSGATEAHVAVVTGDEARLLVLVRDAATGAQMLEAQDTQGHTVAHYAARTGRASMLELILDERRRRGLPPVQPNRAGEALDALAAQARRRDVVELCERYRDAFVATADATPANGGESCAAHEEGMPAPIEGGGSSYLSTPTPADEASPFQADCVSDPAPTADTPHPGETAVLEPMLTSVRGGAHRELPDRPRSPSSNGGGAELQPISAAESPAKEAGRSATEPQAKVTAASAVQVVTPGATSRMMHAAVVRGSTAVVAAAASLTASGGPSAVVAALRTTDNLGDTAAHYAARRGDSSALSALLSAAAEAARALRAASDACASSAPSSVAGTPSVAGHPTSAPSHTGDLGALPAAAAASSGGKPPAAPSTLSLASSSTVPVPAAAAAAFSPAALVALTNRRRATVLHLAAAAGSVACVSLCLNANPDAALCVDANGDTPAHVAALNERGEVLRVHAHGCSVRELADFWSVEMPPGVAAAVPAVVVVAPSSTGGASGDVAPAAAVAAKDDAAPTTVASEGIVFDPATITGAGTVASAKGAADEWPVSVSAEASTDS